MNVLFADNKIYAGYGEHYGEQYYGRSRCEGWVAAAVAVEHIVNIAYYGVHLRCVKICAEEGHSVAVRLEGAYKAGYYQIEYHRGDERQRYAGKYAEFGGAVYAGGVVVVLVDEASALVSMSTLKGITIHIV